MYVCTYTLSKYTYIYMYTYIICMCTYISSMYPTPSHPPITYSIPCHNGPKNPKSSSHASISIDVLQLRSIVTEGWTHRALGGFRLGRIRSREGEKLGGFHTARWFFGGEDGWEGTHFWKKKSARFFYKSYFEKATATQTGNPPAVTITLAPDMAPPLENFWHPKIHLPRSSKGLFPTKNVITWKSTNRIALLHQPLKPMQNKKKSQPPKVFDWVVKHHHSRIIRGPGLFSRIVYYSDWKVDGTIPYNFSL